MSEPVLESGSNGFKLRGAVTLLTAPLLLDQFSPSSTAQVTMDLSETEGSDSSLVALLLGWSRQSKTEIVCQNVPGDISSLIELYGLKGILLR